MTSGSRFEHEPRGIARDRSPCPLRSRRPAPARLQEGRWCGFGPRAPEGPALIRSTGATLERLAICGLAARSPRRPLHSLNTSLRWSARTHLSSCLRCVCKSIAASLVLAWAALLVAIVVSCKRQHQDGPRRLLPAGGLVPIILVATYPGLLLFRNVLIAELLFAVFLNLAMAGLLVATRVGKRRGAGRSLPPSCAQRSRRASDRREPWSPSWSAPASPGQTRSRVVP